jgi:hypothetical protein
MVGYRHDAKAVRNIRCRVIETAEHWIPRAASAAIRIAAGTGDMPASSGRELSIAGAMKSAAD